MRSNVGVSRDHTAVVMGVFVMDDKLNAVLNNVCRVLFADGGPWRVERTQNRKAVSLAMMEETDSTWLCYQPSPGHVRLLCLVGTAIQFPLFRTAKPSGPSPFIRIECNKNRHSIILYLHYPVRPVNTPVISDKTCQVQVHMVARDQLSPQERSSV